MIAQARVALALLALLIVAGPASAHVEVLPERVTAGEALELTVRVPTERDIPTVVVRVDFPRGAGVYSLGEPPPGWRARAILTADKRLAGVRYAGGSIGVERYADFKMLARARGEGRLVFRARQTYADGEVKPWTLSTGDDSAPESGPTDPGPAAIVEAVAAGTPVADGSGAVAAPGDEDDDGSSAGIWLGVVAIAIAALAALGTGLLWSGRPARLPPDDEDER